MIRNEPIVNTLTEPSVIAGSLASIAADWCVYEHHMQTDPSKPPELVYIGCCRLAFVLTAPDARQNTEWLKVVGQNQPVMIRITHTGNMSGMLNARAVLLRSDPPRCNRFGLHTSNGRGIRCSNGMTFATQTEAAETLGISQSQLSKHLRRMPGATGTINGYTFEYI